MSTEKAQENRDAATKDLWRIAETDRTDQVESLLAGGADIDASNAQGMTALMRAAASGRMEMVRVLLEHGANPNRSRNDNFTPLMLAAFFGHQEIVRILVEHGANVQATTRSGTSAQMWAARGTFDDVVHYLQNPRATGSCNKIAKVGNTRLSAGNARETNSAKDDDTPNSKTPSNVHASSLSETGRLTDATRDLWRIAETDNSDQIEPLLANGADIDASNAQGMTALMRAAASGRIQMVRVLLEHGADPNRSRNDNFTPLMLAAFFGHQEIVRLLVDHGANVQATTRSGASAQMWATRGEVEDVFRYLGKPGTTRRSNREATVSYGKSKGGSLREANSAKDDGALNSKTPIEREKADFPAELGTATVVTAVQSDDELPEVLELLPYFVSRPQILSRVQWLNTRIRVYGLTALLFLAAVFAHLNLESKQRLREMTAKTHSSATINRSALVVIPPSADSLPTASETKEKAPSDAQAASSNNVATNYKQLNESKDPLKTNGIIPIVDTGRSSFTEKQKGITNVSHPRPLAVPTPEEERTTELSVAAASIAKPQPPVPREGGISMKRPVPLSTQLISGSNSSPATGKVIQWP